MRRTYANFSTSALALGFMSTAVWADVTAQDVWNNFETLAGANGYHFSTAPKRVGQDVVFGDVSITFKDPTQGNALQLDFSSLRFQGNPDGTVSIVVPSQIPFSLDVPDYDAGKVRKLIGVHSLKGAEVVASGTPDAISFGYRAENMSMTTIDQDPAVTPNMDLRLDMGDLRGRMDTAPNGGQTLNAEAKSIEYVLTFKEPDNIVNMFTGGYSDVVMASTTTVPMGQVATRTSFEQGQAGSVMYSFGSGRSEIALGDADTRTKVESTSRSGELRMTSNKNETSFDLLSEGLNIRVEAAGLGFPVTLSGDKLKLAGAMPTLASREPQAFSLEIALEDVALGDQLWSMFDPTNALSHAPMRLMLNVDGTGVQGFDLTPSQEELPKSTDAGWLETLNINALGVSLLGAELTGNGRFVFDSIDTKTYDGFPKPEGKADLRLTGLNAALDSLIKAGLVQADQMMMPRMMLGMFTRPVGDDAFETDLQFGKNGDIRMNGQRLR